MLSLLKQRASLEFQGGGAPWRAEGDSHHTLPPFLEMRVTRDLSREAQKQVRKKTPLPFVFLDYKANMQTPQTKLPQREPPPPQAPTPQWTRWICRSPCSRWRLSLGSTSIIPQYRLQELLSNLQSLSQMNSCHLGQSGLGNTFRKRIKK